MHIRVVMVHAGGRPLLDINGICHMYSLLILFSGLLAIIKKAKQTIWYECCIFWLKIAYTGGSSLSLASDDYSTDEVEEESDGASYLC